MTGNDQEIIQEIREGNSRRFSVLVERYKDRGMTLAVRLVGNHEEAEELLQDAFVRAHRSLDQFRGESKFSTWFYRILYNLCMTNLSRRKNKPVQVKAEDPLDLDTVEVDDGGMNPHEMLEAEEVSQILHQEVMYLPEHFRAAVTLFYLQEMSYEDLAETLGLPLGTVKSHLFRARAALRQRLLKRMKDGVHVS